MMIISRWVNMGPEWKTEEIFRIRELLKENRIPFRMPASDLFFPYSQSPTFTGKTISSPFFRRHVSEIESGSSSGLILNHL